MLILPLVKNHDTIVMTGHSFFYQCSTHFYTRLSLFHSVQFSFLKPDCYPINRISVGAVGCLKKGGGAQVKLDV